MYSGYLLSRKWYALFSAIPHFGGSLNARGIRDFQKRQTVFTWIKKPLLYGKLRKRAVCGEFCVLIGHPSGQDDAILPARDSPFCSRK